MLPEQDLESALAVSRAMAASPLASLIGGHCGWKLGWKNIFAERPTLCGPLFSAGLLKRYGRTCAHAAHAYSCLLHLLGIHMVVFVLTGYSPVKILAGSGVAVSLSEHRVFSAEAEFCAVLGSALTPRKVGPPYTEAEVWAAVDRVELCVELCGARQFHRCYSNCWPTAGGHH
eukprot:COSAG05_NODE_401_length_10253_cov_23.087453_3_plen_173_part_00